MLTEPVGKGIHLNITDIRMDLTHHTLEQRAAWAVRIHWLDPSLWPVDPLFDAPTYPASLLDPLGAFSHHGNSLGKLYARAYAYEALWQAADHRIFGLVYSGDWAELEPIRILKQDRRDRREALRLHNGLDEYARMFRTGPLNGRHVRVPSPMRVPPRPRGQRRS